MRFFHVLILVGCCFVNIYSQTSKPIIQISDIGDAIRFSHNDGTFTDVPNHSIGVVQTFPKSTSIQITIKSEGERDRILGLSTTTLLVPSFTTTQAILDTISAWTASGATTISPLPLIVDVVGRDSVRVLDSVRVWFDNKKDTIDFEYESYCYRSKIDSGVYEFNVIFDIKTPASPSYMAFVDIDSLYNLFIYDNGNITGTSPNFALDYVPCEKWDEYLQSIKLKDTLKALVFMPKAKVVNGIDTIYNCKSIAFGRKFGASGNLIIGYEDGDSQSFDIAIDELPTWENGEFISWLRYDATATTGLILKTLGCNQSDISICAKPIPIEVCETNTIITTCSGWASGSGIWSTSSGCWNTGQ